MEDLIDPTYHDQQPSPIARGLIAAAIAFIIGLAIYGAGHIIGFVK